MDSVAFFAHDAADSSASADPSHMCCSSSTWPWFRSAESQHSGRACCTSKCCWTALQWLHRLSHWALSCKSLLPCCITP